MMSEEEKEVLEISKTARSWRFTGLGARPEELFETFSKIETLSDWYKEFSKLAHGYEKMADAIEDDRVKASNYLTAAVYYHMGELLLFEDNEEKIQTFNSMVRVYEKASKYFWKPVERVEYTFRDTSLSAYFRKAVGIEKTPCVLLLRGADACKEVELHIISNYFLEKGLSTLAIDCPGQGEARLRGLYMTPDFEEPVGAAIDYLEKRPDVDSGKIGILGQSFGGYIAPRAASLEKRIKACTSLGGFYSKEEFEDPPEALLALRNAMKITADEWPQKIKDYSLEGVIDKMTCPLLVVNGSADKVIPISQSVKIYEKALCPKDLKIYEGCGHCVYYENKESLSYIADWTSVKLHENSGAN